MHLPVHVEVDLERSSVRGVVMVEVLLQEGDNVVRIVGLIGRRKHALVGGRANVVLVEERVHWYLPQTRERFRWTFENKKPKKMRYFSKAIFKQSEARKTHSAADVRDKASYAYDECSRLSN